MAKTGKNQTDLDSGLLTEEKEEIKEPGFYNIYLHNDDYTTMEFVVNILVNIFHKTMDEATKVMYIVHKEGRAVAGVYTKEIAETKINQVSKLARQNQYPLKVTMEKK